MRGGIVHAVCVRRGAEEVDGAFGTAVRFQTFVGLLAVVEGWAEAVDLHERRGDEGGLAPGAGGDVVFGLDMAVDCRSLVCIYAGYEMETCLHL